MQVWFHYPKRTKRLEGLDGQMKALAEELAQAGDTPKAKARASEAHELESDIRPDFDAEDVEDVEVRMTMTMCA